MINVRMVAGSSIVVATLFSGCSRNVAPSMKEVAHLSPAFHGGLRPGGPVSENRFDADVDPGGPAVPGRGPNPGHPKMPDTTTIIVYAYYRCDNVSWTQSCNPDFDVTAPPGYIACTPVFTLVSGGGNAYLAVKTDNFIQDNPKTPQSYRSFRFTMFAQGSLNPVDQTGAHLDLAMIGLTVVPESYSAGQRDALQCERWGWSESTQS